ncbi:hypothetical protein [Pyrodictium abyssi]|uniref:Uncharacterized protein n=1 Tax=Pyrodictium abyssi TaxID=54256 RepID=A0ABN6ZU08_9CREN|nr:hypothetical protein PABY_08050 [Pyrodictium abyssi]
MCSVEELRELLGLLDGVPGVPTIPGKVAKMLPSLVEHGVLEELELRPSEYRVNVDRLACCIAEHVAPAAGIMCGRKGAYGYALVDGRVAIYVALFEAGVDRVNEPIGSVYPRVILLMPGALLREITPEELPIWGPGSRVETVMSLRDWEKIAKILPRLLH